MRFLLILLLLTSVRPLDAAKLTAKTVGQWEKYIAAAEASMERRERGGFLWAIENADRAGRVRRGEIAVSALGDEGERELAGGMVHDWIGAVFLPDARVDDVVAIVRDYDRHKKVYAPEVTDSEILDKDGDRLHVRLRLVKKKVLTATLETEHEAVFERVSDTRRKMRSESIRIAEVENAGTPKESLKPVGDDNGFLWRMNVYWRFEQSDGGVWVECRAISLSRKPPMGLGWIIRPIIDDLPQESLTHTLEATKRAVRGRS